MPATGQRLLHERSICSIRTVVPVSGSFGMVKASLWLIVNENSQEKNYSLWLNHHLNISVLM